MLVDPLYLGIAIGLVLSISIDALFKMIAMGITLFVELLRRRRD